MQLKTIKTDVNMRKFMLALVCMIVPFAFWSCEEVEELVGSIDMTLGDKQIAIPAAVFANIDGTTTVAGTNVQESIAISFKGSATGSYTLGLGKTMFEALRNVTNITDMENTLVYVPSSGIKDDGMTAICGELTITKYSANKVEGEFTGYGLKTSVLNGDFDLSNLQDQLQEFSGHFEAVGGTIPQL